MRMGAPDTIKVVFLIDRKSGSHDESAFAAIKLAVLKLLTHFSRRDGKVNEKMRWGFRIFDSTKECQMYKKRAIWLQYSYKHFNDFEEHFGENVTRHNDKIRSKTSTHLQPDHGKDCSGGRNEPWRSGVQCEEAPDGDAAAPSSSSNIAIGDSEDASSAYALRYALQDVMHDFQWEEPDMCSPMKSSFRSRSSRHRRKKRENSRLSASRRQSGAISNLISDGRQKHRRKEKMIFLAMQCPPTMKILEEFVGDASKLNSALSLRDTIITKEFLTDFCGQQNGSLFWLNTSMVPPAKPTYELLGQMLSHMGGQVISLGWLMNRSSHVTSCLHSVQATQQALEQKAVSKTEKMEVHNDIINDEDDPSAKKIPVPRNLLPLSIIIDHFLRSNIGSEPGMSDEMSCTSKDTFQATLCSVKAETRSDHCMLRMMPMFTPKSECENSDPSSPQLFILRNTEESKTAKRKTARNQSNNTSGQVSANQNKAFSLETGDQTPSQLTSSSTLALSTETHTVTIRAKIDRRQLELGTFDSSSTLSCIGYDLVKGREDDGSSGARRGDGQLSRWFRDAMLDLSQQRMLLIIELSSSTSSMTTLGVMEPLTPAMASVRLIHPKCIMPLATTVAFQSLPGLVGQTCDDMRGRGPAVPQELKRFMEKSAKLILGSGGKTGRHTSTSLQGTEELSALPETDPDIMEELSHIETATHEPFHASWLEPWHISAPSRHTCDQVVEQLLSIPDDRPSPSLHARRESHHDTFFKQLKNLMEGEKGSTEVTSPLSKPRPEEQSKTMLKDATGVRQSPRLKRMKSMPSYVGGRTAYIMANSRKLQAIKPKVTVKDKRGTTLIKKKSDPIPIKLPDVSSLEDLTKHLKQNYDDVLTRNWCSLRFTQSTVAVVLHFYKTSQHTSTQEDSISSMRALITDILLLSNKQLRQRYSERSNDPGIREVRVQEVEMQTLLRLEMESVEPTDIAAVKEEEKKKKGDEEEDNEDEDDDDDDDDDIIDLPEALQDSVDEAVHMLQTVAIFASADKLTAFLTDVVLANYAETIPYMVRAIYEGLVTPVPFMLMSPSSDVSGVPSLKQPVSYRSISSGGSLITLGSNSNRSRALVRHPSIADAAPKRIIGVPARRLPNEKKTDDAEKKKKEQDNTAKTVKRNLFNDDSPDVSKLSRRRSVAVMETHAPRRSPRKAVRSSQLVLKTRVVKETPGKKQVLKAMLNKQDIARKRSTSKERATPGPGGMLVIEESPEKPIGIIQPDVRRSPRVHTLKRRPSFYKKQEMYHAKLLGARIAGTSPPAVALKETLLSEKKADDKCKLKLSPATFLLSAIISPPSKAMIVKESPAKAGSDSPSRNTRSKVGVTPVKAVMDSPGRSAVRTTPRAKARRRLNDQLFKDVPKKSPAKDHSSIPSTPAKSPSEAPIGLISSGHRQSPRLSHKSESTDKLIDRKGALVVPVKNSFDSMEESIPVNTSTRHSPRKALRKIAFGSTEDAVELKDRSIPECKENKTKVFDNATGREGSSLNVDYEAEGLVSRTEKNEAMVRGKSDESSARLGGEPVQAAERAEYHEPSAWFDKLSEGSTDKEHDMDQDNVGGRKRRRSTPCKEDLGTPPIKHRHGRRDTCTPPYVPASKCTTPEVINSWPRKKARYNSPSPCTSKVLSPCGISPIAKVDDIIANWTSPRTRRRTPQSSSKQKGSVSGRKRKRQSPGISSSEKKPRRSTGSTKSSPRAKGSLLSMLTSKNNLEQGCISPVFGKPSLDPSTSDAPGTKTGMVFTKKSPVAQKKQQPVRKCKSPGAKGSVSSDESLDDLDRSFSPIFGKNVVTDPSDSLQSDNGNCSKEQTRPNTAKMSFIDQGLDSDVDTDPEIDFPRLKSSEGSVDILSDSEMVMMMDKDLELAEEKEVADKLLSRRHLRRSSCENCSGDESDRKKLRKRKSSQMSLDQKPDGEKQSSTHRTLNTKQDSKEKLRNSSNVEKTLRKRMSLEEQDLSCRPIHDDSVSDKTDVQVPNQLSPRSILKGPVTKLLEDVENTRPEEPPKKKGKKRVTLATRISSSLGQRRSTPSRLSMTLKRPSAGENWSVTNSPEPSSLMGASEDFSLNTESSMSSSADDEVFERSGVTCTPPTQSVGKPSFVTTPLSTTGLFSLMNSPMVASGNRRSSTGTPKSGRTGRSSRRNLPLQ